MKILPPPLQLLYVLTCIDGCWYRYRIPLKNAKRKHPRPWLNHHGVVQLQPGMQDLWLHDPSVIFPSFNHHKIVRIETHHSILQVSYPLESIFCLLLLRQDVQPNDVYWAIVLSWIYSSRGNTMKWALHSLFIDCTNDTLIQLGVNVNDRLCWLRKMRLDHLLQCLFKVKYGLKFVRLFILLHHLCIDSILLKLSIAKILFFLRFRKFSNLCAECLLLVRNLKCLNHKLYSYWELKRLVKNNHSTS